MGIVRALLIASCYAGACACLAQSNPNTRRVITLNVAAINGTGAPVTDLKDGEMTLREDGKPRPIVFFRSQAVRSAMGSDEKGWFANSTLPPATVVLLDAWNDGMFSASRSWNLFNEEMDHVDPGTPLYVYFLTSQGDLLAIHAIPGLQTVPGPATAATSADLRAKFEGAYSKLKGLRDNNVQDPLVRSDATFRALSALFARMATLSGRKSLIWITGGVPIRAQMLRLRQVVDFTPQIRSLSGAAVRASVAIYTVNQVPVGAALAATNPARTALQLFSDLTGGRFYGNDQIGQALAGTAADDRGMYRVAYEPAAHDGSAKEHKIQIDSSRRGVRLTTVESFTGDESSQKPDEAERVRFEAERSGPFDATEIHLRIAMSHPAGAPIGHFDIRVDPADLLLDRTGGGLRHGELSVMMAFYSEGILKQMTNPARLSLDLTESQFDEAMKNGVSLPEDAPLGSDSQSVRVMVFDRNQFTLGSVTIPIE